VAYGAWDPRLAALGLHLVVTGERWILVGDGGELARIDTAPDPVAALRAHLARVSAAFPDEDGLTLVPGPDASAAALVTAAAGAWRDTDGRALFGRLALAERAPTPRVPRRGIALAERVARRAGARVRVVPDQIAGLAGEVRRCYQDLLERRPALAGIVRFDGLRPRPGVDRSLRECAARTLLPTLREAGLSGPVSVELAPR
jgi:hypothetical protein